MVPVVGGTFAAVLVILLNAQIRSNPGRVPFRTWFFSCYRIVGTQLRIRGVFGCLVAFSLWLPPNLGALWLGETTTGLISEYVLDNSETDSEKPETPPTDSTQQSSWVPVFLVALGLPLGWRGLRRSSTGRSPNLAGRFLQKADELTFLYFDDLISETLGAVSSQLEKAHSEEVIEVAYESSLESMIIAKAESLPETERGRALGLARVQSPMQRIRYLLDYYGVERLQTRLEDTKLGLEEGSTLPRFDRSRLEDPDDIKSLLDLPDLGVLNQSLEERGRSPES